MVFAMFGLVLGLAVTEVLAGFSRVIKMRRKAHIGWLTPLLGLYVLIVLTSFWNSAYSSRENFHANLATLLGVLLLVGTLYLIASLVFPEDPEEWPDFDAYYDRHNRQIIATMLAITLFMQFGIWIATDHFGWVTKADGVPGPYMIVTVLAALLHLPLLVALIFVKSRRWNVAMLAAIDLLLIVAAVAWVI